MEALALALFFGALAATSIVATVRTLVRDGYRRVATKEQLIPTR
jgi:hypothetical protein